MRLFSLFPFFRTRRLRTIKIKRVLPPQPAIAIVLHSIPALTVFALLIGFLVLLAMAGAASVWGRPNAIADPGLFSVLLSAHACTILFALNQTAPGA